MLLAAYAADKALFDGLWAYYKTNSNSKGFMNWKISGCTGASGQNGATDADLDAAMALIVASKQWPSATSPYTYSTEATTLITAIKTYEIDPSSFQAINGDGWGFGSTCRNPGYQSPAYYRQFATHVSSQASTWNSAVTASYTLLNANRNTTTGLVSNWSTPSGTPDGCNGSNEYGYDACRNPWRMAVEVLWTGNNTAQTNFCIPIASYINGKGAANASGPVPQSGGNGTVNATFVSTYAAGICGATSAYQTIMNSMYTKTVNTVDGSGYFGNTLRVISLFVQTGNFWNPSTISACTLPSATGAITGSTSVCASTTSLTYSVTAVSNATGYTWTIPTGASITAGSGTNSITVTMGTSSGTVTVTPTNTCGNGTLASTSVTVNTTVTPSVTASSTATTICAGTSITLTATPTNGGTTPTYQWKKGGTAISGTTNSTYTTTTAANNDSYTVTITSNATCKSTASATSTAVVITVSTNLTATVSINVAPSNTIYAGQSATFTATYSNGGSSPAFQWKNGGTAIAGATNSNYTTASLSNNNVISLTMTSNASCVTTTQVTSNSITITVNPSPSFDTNISGPTSVISNQTAVTYSVTNKPGMTYAWSVPAGATIVSGQGTNSIVVNFGTTSGNVKLIETNPGGQTSTITVPVTVSATTPVIVSSAETSFKVYPIPCSDKITIELNESLSTEVSYILIDAFGNIVLTKTVTYSGTPIDLEMPFASGMYQLILNWNEYKSVQKIIKQ